MEQPLPEEQQTSQDLLELLKDNEDPSGVYKKKLDQILNTAKQFGILKKHELEFLKMDKPTIPTFYLLLKVHKSLVNPPALHSTVTIIHPGLYVTD